MTHKLIEAARRAKGSEVLLRVMLGDYRADDLLMKLADALEAAEADGERLAGALSAAVEYMQFKSTPHSEPVPLERGSAALAAHRAIGDTNP